MRDDQYDDHPDNPQSDAGMLIWVEVNCPKCGNVNRYARRHCKTCKHTGKVLKSVPK